MKINKFRALKDNISNFKFVYGNLVYDNDIPRIQEDNKNMLFTTCLKGTVGQYIGFKDRIDNEIYTGDIIENGKAHHAIVIFDNKTASYKAKYLNGVLAEINKDNVKNVKVIGNIHLSLDF